ncbi:hypothetical protein OROHE_018685 [Orobanche hederae]
MNVKILRCSSRPNNLLQHLSTSAASHSSSISMAAARIMVAETGGGRMLDRDEIEKTPIDGKYKADKSPLSRWEFLAALGVFLVFSSGLLCIYLTMPAAEYEMLKLPRNLADLRLLKDHLVNYAQLYPAKFVLGYCSTYIFMQTFMIPGTIFMSLLAGALFGVVRGLFLVVFNATAGASSCYFLSKLIGRPIVNWLWPEKLRYFQAEAGLALGDLKSVRDLYDLKTLAVLFFIGSVLLIPTILKRKRVYE